MENLLDYTKNNFIWIPKKEIGYYPIEHQKRDYFDIYLKLEDTTIGKKINEFRINLVNRYCNGFVLDVGIGSGIFLRKRKKCIGYDIDSKAIKYLKENDMYFDIYAHNFNNKNIIGVTFFDSFEHLKTHDIILDKIQKQTIFISIPIFSGLDDILNSKHFKPNEHYWYFTKTGFINYMKHKKFKICEIRDDEIKLGRDNILTFVLRKV